MMRLKIIAFFLILVVVPCAAMEQTGEGQAENDDSLVARYYKLVRSVEDNKGYEVKALIRQFCIKDFREFLSYLYNCHSVKVPGSTKHIYPKIKKEKNRTVNMKGQNQSLLHCFVEHNSINFLLLLLAVKPVVNTHCSPNKNTPLHLACRNLDLPKIKLLVAAGADKTAKNSQGKTPIYFIQDWVKSHAKPGLNPFNKNKDIPEILRILQS